ESPAAPRSVNSQITEGLERTILKALEKDPARRQQSAKELREDLTRFDGAESNTVHWRRWLVGAGAGVALVLAWNFLDLTPPQRIASLAVLPLENLSHDPEQDFFADGMTDEIITQLQQLRGLRVISRTSIMRYKDEPKPLSEIREELNVGAVVEGSVLRSGERLRITARLIDASSEESLWAKQYERDTENVLALLDDVARDIAQEIHIALTPLEEDRLAKANPVKPAAYSAYLKGRFYLAQASPEGMLKALDYFQEAVREDPTYAAAYSGLADVYELLGFHGILLPKDAYPSALEAAQRAIELDPELAEAHTSLARIKIGHEWDWSGADREYRLAISLNPNYVRARTYYSNCLLIMGRVDEAVAEAHKASELDPISPSTLTTSAWTLHLAGQDEASADFLRTALELDPTFQIARRGLGELYEETGRPEEAFSEYQKADVIGGLTEEELSVFATAFDSGGLDAYWRMWIDRNQEEIDEGDVWTYYTARLYARVGDHDRTLEWLERAYEEHHDRLVLLKVEPVFAALRSDPRFVDLVRRVGLP
ncbi:MAG TPA: tetratricopeptide repeat protein, partial [Vicinamibacteria bacterium]